MARQGTPSNPIISNSTPTSFIATSDAGSKIVVPDYMLQGSMECEIYKVDDAEAIDIINNGTKQDQRDFMNGNMYSITSKSTIGTLELFYKDRAPDNGGFNGWYVDRIRGYIIPPITASYAFMLGSQFIGDVYLSTDSSLNNASLVMFQHSNFSRNGDDFVPTMDGSIDNVMLEAGKRYYIEIRHLWSSDYGDFLKLMWQYPGLDLPIPIPRQYLAKYYEKNSGAVWNNLVPNKIYDVYSYVQGSKDPFMEDSMYSNKVSSSTLSLSPSVPTPTDITAHSFVLTSDSGTKIVCNGEEKDSGSTWCWLNSSSTYTAYSYKPAGGGNPRSENSANRSITTLTESESSLVQAVLSGIMSDGSKAPSSLLSGVLITADNDNVIIKDGRIQAIKRGSTRITFSLSGKTTTMDITIL